ncbi:hypothetical protein U9M48_009202 [Paspalum notatum var. saurae]|uniref:Integrase catalytic domain-containing protein n=1 Tax=Paspalum notatum var. saurae TaxID=547442 RepID=A0AAQ3WEL9_PASNO
MEGETEEDEPALLMAQACALANGAEEVLTAPLQLEEPRAQVLLGVEGEWKVEAERWYLDTGASNHMTRSRAAFAELDSTVMGTVRFGDNSFVTIAGRSTVLFSCRDGSHRALTGVYFIPRLSSSIISLGRLDKRGCQVLIENGALRLGDREHKLLVMVRHSVNSLYVLPLHIARPVCLAAKQEVAAWRWHVRFGYISFETLERMAKKEMVRGLPKIEHIAASARQLFPKKAKFRAQDPLELVHGDLCGPIRLATHGGRRYFLLLMDDHSRYMWLRLLTTKDQAAEAIKEIKARAKAETGKKLRVLRTDRGGEFTSLEFGQYCVEVGVGRHLSAPHSPQQNGVVERKNQTVVGMEQCMLKAKGMPAAFWGEAVMTAVYILNRASTKALDVALAQARLTKPGLSKLEDRRPMMLLGYEAGSKAYRMYDPVERRVVISRDVVFNESASWDWTEPKAGEDAQ